MGKRKNPAAVTLGRKGGLARGANIRSGKIGPSGPKGTPVTCPYCGKEFPSIRKYERAHRPTCPKR
jgi:hypothetical protein